MYFIFCLTVHSVKMKNLIGLGFLKFQTNTYKVWLIFFDCWWWWWWFLLIFLETSIGSRFKCLLRNEIQFSREVFQTVVGVCNFENFTTIWSAWHENVFTLKTSLTPFLIDFEFRIWTNRDDFPWFFLQSSFVIVFH